MNARILLAATTVILFSGTANAETYEVRMLNKGEAGAMVFEPAFISAQVGDTVVFLPTDKGHNAESIEGMLPAGAEVFVGEMNKEISVTLVQEGIYGVKCKPHYLMGMVALIQAGAPVNLEEAKAAKHKGKAKSRFEELLTEVK
ncbi:MAG: pseudoazurin [Paracoccaceae bacterium]|nr:pseudoazurin [Paracoccaceae bacterium]MDH5528531.1 pseudoazurin [Paracoccaceae bacterium]